MGEKQYGKKIERINKRRNIVLKLVLFILAILLVAGSIQLLIRFSQHDYNTHETGKVIITYINGVESGRRNETRSTPNPYTLPMLAVCFLALVDVAVLIGFRKTDIIDYRKKLEDKFLAAQNGAFAQASPARRRLFYLSLFLGYAGIDRFAAGCIVRGLLKCAVFFLLIACLSSFISFYPDDLRLVDWILCGIFSLLTFFVWIKDVIALRKGTFKGRKGNYIQ